MKAVLSKIESKKRKRAELQEPITESSKKAKVHAQRKFAQGAAFNSPVITPIKDKVRPPAPVSSSGPILTGKCPNTEDFLTFLCFRRTSLLPAKFDFFKNAFGSETKSAASTDKAHSSVHNKSSSEQTGKQNTKKIDTNDEGKKSQAPAVQALRRKYQEQRLAKQKPTNVTRLAKKVKGKNMVRTRSSAVAEEAKTPVKKNPEKEVTKTNTSGLRSGLKRIQPTIKKIKKPLKTKHLRTGLRSGGSVPETPVKTILQVKSSLIAAKKSDKEAKKSKTEVPERNEMRGSKGKKPEGFSDFSSDDNEPLLAVKKPKTGGKALGKIDGGKHQNKATVKTRSQLIEPEVSKSLLRPTRKTKEAAALYVEMITKKLVSPEKSGDEDLSSVDSFPELPNAKRTEQRETEIKAKAFAPRKPELKQQLEDKTKKNTAKKNDHSVKTEMKNTKDSPTKKAALKKEPKVVVKDDEIKGESSVKRPARTLVKEELIKGKPIEEEKKDQTRPSTRNRPQDIVPPSKKPTVKTVTKQKVKTNEERKQTEKLAETGKKLKINKEEKTKPKVEVDSTKKQKEKDLESFPKSTDSKVKITRKTNDKKAVEKHEVKEKNEPAKKRGRKPIKAAEPEIQIEKPKAGDKKSRKEEEEKLEDASVNKRPTRKCSTIDKIWIDIDGFTSDEDDYLEMTKTRGSAKKANSDSEKSHTKAESEKKLSKPEVNVSDKTKNEKTKDSGQKLDEKKPEPKKPKTENKSQEVGSETEGKKSELKGKIDESVKANEKRDNSKIEKKAKLEVKSSSDFKKNEKIEEKKEKEKKETTQQIGKVKEDEKLGKKEANKKLEIQKKVLRKPKNVKSSKKKKEESESKMRTRPVRQCSTGEKRWIETDSDSFSFYETSDDEDNLPILDFSKVKSSPETKDNKTPKEGKKESKSQKEDDNFSESDEEPLKKKAHVEEISKNAEQEVKTVQKVQREVPGLTPLKKTPTEIHPQSSADIPPGTKPGKPDPPNPSVIPSEKPVFHEVKTSEERVQPLTEQPVVNQIEIPKFPPEPCPVSVPNRIEMILHSLKKDKMAESSASCSNDVKVTFGTVPYSPQLTQIPCTYQVKATFPSPREPISTHGLDLLSEVALPTTPKENISSQTKRIEKWLNDSLTADQKTRFSYDNIDYKTGTQSVTDKPQPEVGYYFGKPLPSPSKGVSSHSEFHKFGQVELMESQKLLKKNLFAVEVKQDGNKVEQQQQIPKKALTSVQDLLKLQKERKEVSKVMENAPHLKNCKCNNCIVKKGWFKNKPVPKAEHSKSSPVEEEASKPFESLTKAFIGEGKTSKMSVSVAPLVVLTTSMPSCSKDIVEKKVGLQQKKLSFLERMKERERKEAAAKAKMNSDSNVYGFKTGRGEKKKTKASSRGKTIDSRTSSTSKSDEEGLKIYENENENEISTVSSGTQVEKPASDKGVKSSQSASIAVQVNLDSETIAEVEPLPELQDGKSIEISTQTEVPEEDSDSPMFYIPLQQATPGGTSASSEQQLIQGVALKLGTEGPMGPNQRVIMKAKLVTKPPDSPSIKAVVMPQPKRMFDQKYTNPPIGTVQPTTRKPPDEQIDNKPESAKSAVSPAKESSEEVPQPTETEVSNSEKSTSTGKPLKNKEKTQNMGKEKPEASNENSPSSSASSSKSKRPSKQKNTESVINPTNSTWLPPPGTSSKLVEAPTFHPTEKEFQDPFEFFDRIRPAAEKFGLCRIVPPSNFKPDCKVSDDMRFTAYNQYVHRMFHRWGPNIKEMMAIKKYLATQSISLKQPPWIGGIEVDLPRLYQSVQNCGGLMKVMEKKKWHQVADMMKIPKAAQDRVTKLDDIYCKYLLPYDTLSHEERQKLFDEVEKDWEERQKTPVESQDSQEDEESEENYVEECEECVVKGRNMALNQFYRIARNTMSMWFRNPEPSPREVEAEFWKHVSERNHHVCVHSGSIDSSGWGYGFPIAKNNSFSKHPWNLKVLTNNSGSVLRYLGPVMGVTVPTLHVGMVFTAFCWYRDPHGLPWIEYLHTGAPKIWYGISDDNSTVFQEALRELLPRYIKNKTIWLPSDTAMIPPELLVEHGVSLCHTVQEPGQFILVFPRAFTSSICTGYLVSESVYFAQLSWLATAEQVFKDIQESCEPSMFSLEKLLFSIAMDSRSSAEVLKQVLPMVWHVRQKEVDGRKTLFNLGLKSSEKLPAREPGSKKKKGRWAQEDDGDYECEICRTNLYVSLVTNSQEEGVYCLPHAIDLLTQKRHQLKYCKLMYTYTQEEMNEIVEKLEQKIESKSQKKPQSKPSTSAK